MGESEDCSARCRPKSLRLVLSSTPLPAPKPGAVKHTPVLQSTCCKAFRAHSPGVLHRREARRLTPPGQTPSLPGP